MFHGVLVVEAVASTEVAARSEVLKFQQEKSCKAGNTTTNLIHNCPPHDAPIPKKRKARIKTEPFHCLKQLWWLAKLIEMRTGSSILLKRFSRGTTLPGIQSSECWMLTFNYYRKFKRYPCFLQMVLFSLPALLVVFSLFTRSMSWAGTIGWKSPTTTWRPVDEAF